MPKTITINEDVFNEMIRKKEELMQLLSYEVILTDSFLKDLKKLRNK